MLIFHISIKETKRRQTEKTYMLFTSLEFLLFFFPVALGVYLFLPHRARNYWLFFVSLVFYAWGEPIFVLVMLFSIICNYFAALHIEELEIGSLLKKSFLALVICINLGILFVFKYMNFLTENLRAWFPTLQNNIQQTNIVLPIGISFFTFQAISYVIDVYRGTPAQKNICYLGLYIAFFPQLIAGPIVRYTTIMDQMEQRKITRTSFTEGMSRFLYGFNKKILLANLLAVIADEAFGLKNLSVGMAWLGAICYSLQIYFDFSGYSEMAIGLGKMFGFDFLENFNYPYISKTITEFWRRWHISLGSWFRDYVYFPLGGSRVKSKARLIFNLAVVWLATGAWHGANWSFIAWGLLHGLMVILEKLFFIPQKLSQRRGLSIIYQIFVLQLVIFGWILFRAEGFGDGFVYIKSMFGLNGNTLADDTFRFNVQEYGVILLAGIICATPVFRLAENKLRFVSGKMEALCNNSASVIQFILFLISISFLVMNTHNPFIYFNF